MFVLAFENNDHGDKNVERNSHGKYLLPSLNITNYNILIDGRNFYDQPTNDQIKNYEEIRKIAIGQGQARIMVKFSILQRPLSINCSWS